VTDLTNVYTRSKPYNSVFISSSPLVWQSTVVLVIILWASEIWYSEVQVDSPRAPPTAPTELRHQLLPWRETTVHSLWKAKISFKCDKHDDKTSIVSSSSSYARNRPIWPSCIPSKDKIPFKGLSYSHAMRPMYILDIRSEHPITCAPC
jgi:hypothetical protein